MQAALAPAELLIADGHHRYETARVYAEEIGGEGEHRYVLMHLVALEDPGLTVFPTHRLISGLADDAARQEALRDTLLELFDVEELGDAERARRRRTATARCDGLHRRPPQAPVPRDAQGPGDRRRARWPTSPSPTAASTPPCSRR